MKSVILPFFLLIQSFLIYANDICDPEGWIAYKDEKCIKVFFSTQMVNFREAEKICLTLDNDSGGEGKREGKRSEARLLTVTTAKEQQFIADYLSKRKKDLLSDVWLGARFDNASKSFRWRVNYEQHIEMGERLISVIPKEGYSEKVFTNWQSGHPKTLNYNQCVQMNLEDKKDLFGKWREEPCGTKKNHVVCERNQLWPVSKVQQALLRFEKAEAELKKEMATIKNPVPAGYIYVQYPFQEPPNKIYPWHQWEDVTDRYNGAFFRAEKNDLTESWGNEQPEKIPHLHHIVRDWCELKENGYSCVLTTEDNKPRGEVFLDPWSRSEPTPIWSVLDYTANKGFPENKRSYGDFLKFYYSHDEVRPRNFAIRIWRRK